jgi:hypothetical protein
MASSGGGTLATLHRLNDFLNDMWCADKVFRTMAYSAKVGVMPWG